MNSQDPYTRIVSAYLPVGYGDVGVDIALESNIIAQIVV